MTYLLLIIIGLVIGSFLNVVIWRYPIMLQAAWRQECLDFLGQQHADKKASRFNLMYPASRCNRCQQRIKPWHNIPIISYLCLRGRCAFCQQTISLIYPIVEAASAILIVCCYIKFGFTLQAGYATLFMWLLLTMAIIDINTQLLPDLLTLGLLWLGLIINSHTVFVSPSQAILAAAIAYLTLWIFTKLYALATKKTGMGHGDFKLFAALGTWLGIYNLLNIILCAALIGLAAGGILCCCRKMTRQQTLAFGPYLALAGGLTMFFGPFINTWINTLMGFN